MKKGFTLLEVIMSITFVGVITLGFLIGAIVLNRNIKNAKSQNQALTELYQLENELSLLHNNYVNDYLIIKYDVLYVDEKCLLQIERLNEQFCYHFHTTHDVDLILDYLVDYQKINQQLLKISVDLVNYHFTRFYQFKEVSDEGFS